MLIDDEVKEVFFLHFEIICVVEMKFKLIQKYFWTLSPIFPTEDNF